MTISQKSIKILWAAAAGRCSFPQCHTKLYSCEADEITTHTIGEMAHICGDKPTANRYDTNQSDIERDDYNNLILLCPTHHTIIDRKENEATYTVESLHQMKSSHEKKVLRLTNNSKQPTKKSISCLILPLLEDNKQSWLQYGPTSDMARKQPYNEKIYLLWKQERLITITPNNRKISLLLKENRMLFTSAEQQFIAAFLMHSDSYEKWVNDTIDYSAVVRFPQDFDNLIRRITNARSK